MHFATATATCSERYVRHIVRCSTLQVLNKVIGIASSPRNRARAEADQQAAKPVKVHLVQLLVALITPLQMPAPTEPQVLHGTLLDSRQIPTVNVGSKSSAVLGSGSADAAAAAAVLRQFTCTLNSVLILPVQPKWVAFTGGSSAKVDAPGSTEAGRQLADYLALPVSQYSLLDERLVER